MRRPSIALATTACFLAAFLSAAALAQGKPPAAADKPELVKPGTPPTAAPAPNDPNAPPAAAKPKLLPEVSFNGVSLEDVVAYLHDVDPSFQAVIVRDVDVPNDYPVIQNLKLKRVSINQLMTVLQKLFPYDIEVIEDDGPPISVLRVHNPSGNGQPVAPAAVQVFRLADAVEAMVLKSGKERADRAAIKDATSKVLSAVNALLTLQGAAGTATLVQVHEDTQTLLVKGPPEQLAAVRSLLDTLEPQAEHAKVAALKKQLADAQDNRGEQLGRAEGARAGIQAQLDSAMTQLREREKELLQKNAEAEKLKLELQSVMTELNKRAATGAGKRGGGGESGENRAGQPEKP